MDSFTKITNFARMKPIRLMTYRSESAVPPLPGQLLPHSSELFHVYARTPGYTPILIVASIEERPVAKLLSVIRRSVRLFPPSIIHRCEVYGTGEYFDDTQNREDLFGQMLEHLTQEVLKDCFLIEFRNLPTSLFGYKHFRRCNYFAMNWIRVYNSLHSMSPEERLDASRRRQINRALRLGVSTKIAESEEEQQAFLQMLKRNYSSKIRKHFPDLKLFHLLTNEYGEHETGKICLVKYGEKIIGVNFIGDNCYVRSEGGKTVVIDFSNPASPKVDRTGSEETFAEELYEVSETQLVGISDSRLEVVGEESVFMPISITLFDVSNPVNPQAVSEYSFEESFRSVAASDSRSVMIDKEKKIIGIPVLKNNKENGSRSSEYVLFDISDGKLDSVGTYVHSVVGDAAVRGICVGDVLYTVSGEKVVAFDINTDSSAGGKLAEFPLN